MSHAPAPAPSRRLIASLALQTAAAAGVGLLAGCAPAVGAPSGTVVSDPVGEPVRLPLRLAIYGDSITVGGNGWYDASAPQAASWVPFLGEECSAVHVVAKAGATTELLASVSAPQSAPDLAVFAFGTNDVHRGRGVQDVVRDVEAFVTAHPSLGPPASVALTAVGPRNGAEAKALEQWNAAVAAAAGERGWLFLDAWQALRGSDAATWAAPELSHDGLHPTPLGARLLGAGYDRALAWAVARGLLRPE